MATNRPVIAAIEAVKERADRIADQHAAACRDHFLRNPMTVLVAATVRPNYKFFRRLAGLAGRDLVRRD